MTTVLYCIARTTTPVVIGHRWTRRRCRRLSSLPAAIAVDEVVADWAGREDGDRRASSSYFHSTRLYVLQFVVNKPSDHDYSRPSLTTLALTVSLRFFRMASSVCNQCQLNTPRSDARLSQRG